MAATVRDLILILQVFFPSDLALHKAFYLLGFLVSLYPLLRLHLNQQRQPHQPARTAWLKSIRTLLIAAFNHDKDPSDWASGLDQSKEYATYISNDLGPLYTMLGLNPANLTAPWPFSLFPTIRTVLQTSHLSCVFCPPADLNIIPTLRRREKPQIVWLLNERFQWVQADLMIAHCATCRADYFPDRITYRDQDQHRRQRLEVSTSYLRVSQHGIWVHRRIAVFQENALNRFHSGWSNFADWLNDSVQSERKLTYRQSQRLFIEHFSRRLLLFHKKDTTFSCRAHPSTRLLSEAVRAAIGIDGGVIEAAMSHGCADCTHIKRYRSDLVNEGFILGANLDVAGIPADPTVIVDANLPIDPALEQLPAPEQENAPPEGEPRGYIRMAGMDGKTLNHRKCALDMCEGPLVNYKDGRFCEDHLNLREICGIIPCGLPIREPGALTCATQSHIDWHRQFENRFSRLSFPGVRRVMRRQGLGGENAADGATGPMLRVDLPALGETPGDQVVHTFKAKRTYCLQTVQWACGFPIGWGKCYRSESSSQVLQILDDIWEEHPTSKPSFLAYDDACSLLRHIVTQNPNSPWLATKFIVDAWHYIGHRATDILCRLWCNPAPVNGSQPDLILMEEDANGNRHQTRAFNTETSEQLNSWLNGFESQLRQMSDVNYDFFVHVLLMIYGERVEKKVESKNLGLSEEFWAQATGN
ncbi:hypothetical protein C8R43DRAFT_521820 [Mycena crocata]|nr:hypothetical protein C8R43DRAFT_521820 [Mycena crocata]